MKIGDREFTGFCCERGLLEKSSKKGYLLLVSFIDNLVCFGNHLFDIFFYSTIKQRFTPVS